MSKTGKTICLVLSILMLITMFLPIISMKTVDYAIDILLDDYVGYGAGEDIVKAVRNSGFVQGVMKYFAKIKLKDFGSELDGYGYYSDYNYDRMNSLDGRLEDRFDDLEDAFYYGDTRAIKSILGDSQTQKDVAEYFARALIEAYYDSIYYDLSDIGLAGQMTLEDMMSWLQTSVGVMRDGKLSLLETHRLTKVFGQACKVLKSFARDENYVLYDRIVAAEKGVRTVSTLSLLLFLVLFIMTACLIVLLLLDKRTAALGAAAIATALFIIEFIVVLIAAGRMNGSIQDLLRDLLGSGMFGNSSLFSAALWPLVSIVMGIVVCILLFGMTNTAGGASRRIPASTVCPGCGRTLDAGARFCGYCGSDLTRSAAPAPNPYPDRGLNNNGGGSNSNVDSLGLKNTMRN